MSKVNWKELVGNIAPAIGAAFGGPAGGLAVAAISNALLGKPDATEAEVEAAVLSASPDTLLELRKANQDFEYKMEQLGVDVFKLEVQDKASARDLAKSNMKPQIILSAVFIIGYFVIVHALVTGSVVISPEHSALVNVLIGVLTSGVASIMQFWFGSSHGSKSKDAGK